MTVTRRKAFHDELQMIKNLPNVVFVLEFDNPKEIPKYFDRIQKSCIAKHLRSEGDEIIYTEKIESPMKLPESVDIHEAADFISHNFNEPAKSLSTFALNERFIAVSINHLASDGGFLSNLIQTIQDSHFKTPQMTKLPDHCSKIFEKQIEKTDPTFEYYDLNNITYSRSKGSLPKQSVNSYAKTLYFREPVEKLQAFDKETRKVHKLTDYIWASVCLSMAAFNNKLGPIGCCVCVDMRSYTTQGSNLLNAFSVVAPCSPVHPDMTINELCSNMRADLNLRLKRGDQYAFFSPNLKITPSPNAVGSLAHTSQLQPFRIKKPIVDIWVQSSTRDIENDNFSILGESCINEDNRKNIFGAFLRYVPSSFNDHDAKKIFESFHHFMLNISENTSLGDAFEELKKFQSKI